ncbi:synaptic plasticity regulator PANTS [Lissotriton helveticus]
MADREDWRPPRACDDYWSEWKNCKSLRNRFHYYYTFGEMPSCQQWKTDYTACREWEKKHSPAAKEALCRSEQSRLEEKKRHEPVWSLRRTPPNEWYLPLRSEKPKQ